MAGVWKEQLEPSWMASGQSAKAGAGPGRDACAKALRQEWG